MKMKQAVSEKVSKGQLAKVLKIMQDFGLQKRDNKKVLYGCKQENDFKIIILIIIGRNRDQKQESSQRYYSNSGKM